MTVVVDVDCTMVAEGVTDRVPVAVTVADCAVDVKVKVRVTDTTLHEPPQMLGHSPSVRFTRGA